MSEQKEFFTGQVINQQRKKVYHKSSKWYGNLYYKLTIASGLQNYILFAYANLLKDSLWKIITNKDYYGHYLFEVQKSKWGWVLLDFRERK